MKLKETEHSYYCSDSNYYNSGVLEIFEVWEEFKDAWFWSSGVYDLDMNHIFRFDIIKATDDEGEYIDRYDLYLFFILQRKGIFKHIWIKGIKEENMNESDELLKNHWEYLKNRWKEFANNIQ